MTPKMGCSLFFDSQDHLMTHNSSAYKNFTKGKAKTIYLEDLTKSEMVKSNYFESINNIRNKKDPSSSVGIIDMSYANSQKLDIFVNQPKTKLIKSSMTDVAQNNINTFT